MGLLRASLGLILAWSLFIGCAGTGGRSDAGVGFDADGGGEVEDGDAGSEGDAGDGDAGEEGDGGDGGGDGEPLAEPDQPGPHAVETAEAEVALGGGASDPSARLAIYLPDDAGPHPVVVLSHGFLLGPEDYASYGRQLASFGFVAILPQLPGSILSPRSHRRLKEDLGKILDWLDAQAADPAGPLAGRADPGRLGLAGHSMGGKISMLLSTEDARPRAFFGIDPVDAAGGPFSSDPVEYPSVTPELMDRIQIPLVLLGETVNATCQGFGCQACAPEEDNFHQYYLHAHSPALEIEVLGANHMAFLDDPNCGLTCSACPAGPLDPVEARRLARRYLIAFFLVQLRGEAAYRAFLDGPGMRADEQAGLVSSQSRNGF